MLEESHLPLLVGIGRFAQGEACGENILVIHSQLLALKILEAARQQHTAGQQHEACSDLRCHQELPQPCVPNPRSAPAGERIHLRMGHAAQQSKAKCTQSARGQGESENPPIDFGRAQERHSFRSDQDEDSQQEFGEENCDKRACGCQRQRFNNCLLQQAHAACAKGGPAAVGRLARRLVSALEASC